MSKKLNKIVIIVSYSEINYIQPDTANKRNGKPREKFFLGENFCCGKNDYSEESEDKQSR